jgi:hypothetical protein
VSERWAGRLAWGLWASYVVLAGLSIVLDVWGSSLEEQVDVDPVWLVVVSSLGLGLFATAGALVAARHRANPIGWMMCGVALLWAVSGVADIGTEIASVRPEWLPVPEGLAWLSEWVWIPGLALGAIFLPLLFPDGRPVTRRWGFVVWLAAAAMVVSLLGEAMSAARVAGTVLLLVGVAAALLSLAVRFRRARGVERQQLKWFVYAVAPLAPAFALLGLDFAGVGTNLGNIGWGAALVTLLVIVPVGTAIAILRYRLYDIDLIIRRTLVYGVLSGLLAGGYFGIVLALQQVFSGFAGGSDLAIAVSTLAVAALFRPVRSRIQALVDRRFYRAKYDAQRTLEAFSARLRDEIDLEALTGELRAVVQETIQPAHVSLWLRTPEARP